jgi:hypothetical protein
VNVLGIRKQIVKKSIVANAKEVHAKERQTKISGYAAYVHQMQSIAATKGMEYHKHTQDFLGPSQPHLFVHHLKDNDGEENEKKLTSKSHHTSHLHLEFHYNCA